MTAYPIALATVAALCVALALVTLAAFPPRWLRDWARSRRVRAYKARLAAERRASDAGRGAAR